MAYFQNRPFAVMLTSLLGSGRWPQTQEELDRFVNELLHADWEADDGPFRIKRNLPLEQVADAPLFSSSRELLRTLIEDQGAPLTPGRNLNRAVILRLIERMELLRRRVEYARRVFGSRKFDEWDVPILGHIRAVSEFAGLAITRRNRLLATRKAVAMCADAQAGALLRLLFVTFFRRFSLDNLFSTPTPLLQQTIAVILWRLSMSANDWIAVSRLRGEVLHPAVRAEILAAEPGYDLEAAILTYKVLESLCWFGLLETDIEEEDRTHQADPKYRKTPLFDQFLSFHFTP